MNKNFLESLLRFEISNPNETIAAAVSGGPDSMAMLEWLRAAGAKIVALTIDHGLRAESAAEAAAVAAHCAKIGVPHTILKWTGAKPTTGVEEAARAARYELMTDFCRKNNIGVIATAHHQDDQIETFWMNLARGSGVYGLSGMREISERDGMIIFRPLLATPRSELRAYCDEKNIPYFMDAMNEDEKYLRVRVRKTREDLGITDDKIALAIENISRARDALETEAAALARKLHGEFDAAELLAAPDEIRFRALSIALGDEYPLRLEQIKNAFAQLDTGNAKFTLAGKNIRILNNKIRIWAEGKNFNEN
ncbi:MAG: tRNA lysidine(34) synthetase TilS [Rickettsiales bacterium]|jgi:tRNA(Ile)-lysidine synthase|nr:tRNA lysidine(34) synthetase TilS [Rickettsiales bacterium]